MEDVREIGDQPVKPTKRDLHHRQAWAQQPFSSQGDMPAKLMKGL
jgi:hypothetical protein